VRVYVSGPVSGRPREEAVRAFADAARDLRDRGHDPIDPMGFPLNSVDGLPWSAYLRQDLAALVLVCDGILMLKGWTRSRGARLERSVAKRLGLAVMYADDAERDDDGEAPAQRA
jgi:hypothetical protein